MAMNTVRHILQLKGGMIWSISPGRSVLEALRLMADKDIGALLIMEDDRLVGILSERDYARKIILQNKTSKDTLVGDIMTTKVFTVHPDQTVHEAMEIMNNNHIRHLPVVEDDRVIGVISVQDTVRNIIYAQRETIKSLEDKITR